MATSVSRNQYDRQAPDFSLTYPLFDSVLFLFVTYSLSDSSFCSHFLYFLVHVAPFSFLLSRVFQPTPGKVWL